MKTFGTRSTRATSWKGTLALAVKRLRWWLGTHALARVDHVVDRSRVVVLEDVVRVVVQHRHDFRALGALVNLALKLRVLAFLHCLELLASRDGVKFDIRAELLELLLDVARLNARMVVTVGDGDENLFAVWSCLAELADGLVKAVSYIGTFSNEVFGRHSLNGRLDVIEAVSERDDSFLRL